MKAALISLGSKSSKWTAEAMKEYFDEVDELDLRLLEINLSGKDSEILYEGKLLKEYDCIYSKGSFRYAALLSSLALLLKNKTYLPLESRSYTIGHDKLLTQMELQNENIPTPKTYLAATTIAAKKNLRKMNYPIIMKFPKGTQGKGVMFAESYAAASSMLDALTALNQPFIIQEFVDTRGIDIRAFVIGDKVVEGMARKSDVREARSNIHAGGKAEVIVLNEETKRIAVKAAKVTGVEICGVDIMEGPSGPLVIEVNLSPGLQGINQISDKNIPKEIAKYLYKKTIEKKNKNKRKESKKILKEVDISSTKELITTIDFRGARILIPEVITKISNLKDTDTVQLISGDGEIKIKKFM